MPSLMEAYKLSSRAARVGFDWPEMEGLFEKLAEETVELREELNFGNQDLIPRQLGLELLRGPGTGCGSRSDSGGGSV